MIMNKYMSMGMDIESATLFELKDRYKKLDLVFK